VGLDVSGYVVGKDLVGRSEGFEVKGDVDGT